MVPFDPAIPDEATVGGVLAANVSGPARVSPRHAARLHDRHARGDGGRAADARGRQVVKNVAGYDLCKLYIGSLGTLGVIVEATFKTGAAAAGEQLVARLRLPRSLRRSPAASQRRGLPCAALAA